MYDLRGDDDHRFDQPCLLALPGHGDRGMTATTNQPQFLILEDPTAGAKFDTFSNSTCHVRRLAFGCNLGKLNCRQCIKGYQEFDSEEGPRKLSDKPSWDERWALYYRR